MAAAATTPRRSMRLPHTHTPKMSERKKSLFQGEAALARESMTKHRNLPVLNSESDSDDCDLGIISTLDSSSSDENEQTGPKTPERRVRHDTRSQSQKLIKESNELKSFIKSPFTLKKYQTRSSCSEKCSGSISTPVTPHIHNHPATPSSTHSCTSVHTTSSSSSRARKSLADLIADTESCSSSLKDLNFDTDSGTDTKENTPTKSVRRSTRKKLTPKLSFKGILVEHKKNITPIKNPIVSLSKTDLSTVLPKTPENVAKLNENTKVVTPANSSLTKMDMESAMSPSHMMKTPQNSSEAASPPKMMNRKFGVEIAESPESEDGEKSNKRAHYDGMTEIGPAAKHPRLDFNSAPKARLSLFNSERLKEILSTKSFYGKSNPELNTSITAKISNVIEMTNSSNRRGFSHSHSHRRRRAPGQINSGVRHKIRKPKINKSKIIVIKGKPNLNSSATETVNNSTMSNSTLDASMISHNSSQEMDKTHDPFLKEKRAIDALLSQWTEEEVPEEELSYSKTKNDLPIFNSTIIEETNQIFQPVTAIPVDTGLISSQIHSQNSDTVIVELGAQTQHVNGDREAVNSPTSDIVMSEVGHGDIPKNGQFLPVDGGYILVEGSDQVPVEQEVLPDLDEIERELERLDEQILKMAESNNIDPKAVIASTEETLPADSGTASGTAANDNDENDKLFPIFKNPNPGITTPTSKGDKNKKILKTGMDQYVIDAGQKKFGATQCTECGVIYQIGDPQDEHDHLVHHNASDVLRFNGWREEYVIERSETSRIIRVRGGEQGWKKVLALLQRVIHPQLGYSADLPKSTMHYTAYLYIEKKQILGCLIAEPKTKAYKLIPGDPDCCSVESYPVKCGISRIWTHASHRHQGIARQLLNCARVSFLYGTALSTSDLAFSAPTQAGKALATKYCATENFYVYLE